MNTYGKRYPGSGFIVDAPSRKHSDLDLDTKGLRVVRTQGGRKGRRLCYASVRFDK